MNISECRTIDFGKIEDSRGSLSFIEGGTQIPFEIRRVFYIYGVPPGEVRGAHAHKTLHQFIVCVAGSFDVKVHDGQAERRYRLDDPGRGLYIPPLIWDTEENFAAGSVCLVLASDHYAEDDYYRDYEEYRAAVARARGEVR